SSGARPRVLTVPTATRMAGPAWDTSNRTYLPTQRPPGLMSPGGLRSLLASANSKRSTSVPADAIETRSCQYVEEVLNHHHLDGLAAYVTRDVVVNTPGIPPVVAGIQRLLGNYLSAFPDFHLTIEAVLA